MIFLVTSWLQRKACNLTLSKQITLIKKHHQVAKRFLLLFNLFQRSQVKRRSSMLNRKSRNKSLNPLNTSIILHQKQSKEIGSYALIHGTKAAINRFAKVYTKYLLKRTTVNGLKEIFKKNDLHSIRKRRRPNLVDDEVFSKIKDAIIGSRLVCTAISRKMVVVISTSVVMANEHKILRDFDRSLELTEG